MVSGKQVDWAYVEKLYRLGEASIREIGRLAGVSEATIRAHAREGGWIRNLRERVRTAVDERIATEEAQRTADHQPGAKLSDEAIIQAAAAAGVAVVRRQRATVNEAHIRVIGILFRMKTFFDSQDAIDEMEKAILEETAEPAEGQEHPLDKMARLARRRKLQQLITLPSQINQIQGVAGALARIIPIERITFGLSEKGERGENEGNTMEDILQRLSDDVSGTRFLPR